MTRKIVIAAAALSAAVAVPLLAAAGSDWHGAHRGMERPMMGHHGMGMGMGGPGGMRGEGRHGDMHAKLRMLELIEVYDTDGNGSLTQEEIDAGRTARLKQFDADGNGMLSLAEYEALWLDAMREHMVRRFQGHDRDGDGQVTTEEFGRRMSHMVLLRDRNGDGVLDLNDVGRPGDEDDDERE